MIVRQIGTGQDQRFAACRFDHLRQGHAQRAAALVALVSHDDGHEFKTAQNPLQPRQLDLDCMLGACRRGIVSLGWKAGWWNSSSSIAAQTLCRPERSQRRCIGIAVIDRGEIEGLEVRGRNHHDARILVPFQRSVGEGSHRAGVLDSLRVAQPRRESVRATGCAGTCASMSSIIAESAFGSAG